VSHCAAETARAAWSSKAPVQPAAARDERQAEFVPQAAARKVGCLQGGLPAQAVSHSVAEIALAAEAPERLEAA